MFYFHPENWGRWTQFDDHMFQRGWFNHQLENTCGIISSRKPWNRFWVQQGLVLLKDASTRQQVFDHNADDLGDLRLQKHQRSGLSCPRVWHHCWCERRQVRVSIIWVVATQIFLDVSSHNMGKMNPIWRFFFVLMGGLDKIHGCDAVWMNLLTCFCGWTSTTSS